MCKEQAGFRLGRGCSDQIFVLCTIIEECREWNRSLILNFFDFKRTFDSVHRPSMWKFLEKYGFLNMIFRILSLLDEGSQRCVRDGLEHTAWFGVDSGVLQGDALSPISFNRVLDYVMAKLSTVDGGIDWIGGKRLKDLDFADDICLFVKDIYSLKAMTEIFLAETTTWS